jgi:hypothetical protein
MPNDYLLAEDSRSTPCRPSLGDRDMVSEPIVAGLVPGSTAETNAAQPELETEKAALLAWLNQQRAHALGILDGLDEAALRQPVLPSRWSCLGMVQHLAGIERFWYRAVVAGERAVIDGLADEPNEWLVAPEVSVGAVFDRYRRESEQANAIIAATPWTPRPSGGRTSSVTGG